MDRTPGPLESSSAEAVRRAGHPGPELQPHGPDGEGLRARVWRLAPGTLAVSSAPLGGGIGPCGWVVNAQVPHSYDRRDPAEHLRRLAAGYGLRGPGVGMLTAVDVRHIWSAEDDGVVADVSVGITWPTWAAAPDELATAPLGAAGPAVAGATGRAPSPPGTINVVALVPARLSPAALVNAAMTVTEAKAQALWEAGVAATGTASDAVCVACPAGGEEEPFGGPRSHWGAR
ncbi:MAG TPA: adenosylcobinamide amidohydrolase, partial [Acidimicrobiales bacterium]|nr:adenosylcobinamide amidohydrolase [Acidimicrobiales bacterium]